MIFVRTGPRFLFLFTPQPENLTEVLIKELRGSVTTLIEAIEMGNESDTIVMVTPDKLAKAKVNDAHTIVLLPFGSSITLSRLISLNLGSLLAKAELGPGLLLQRLPQGGDKVMELIQEEHHGLALGLEEAINLGEANDTVLFFTENPLHKSVPVDKVLEPVLLIAQPIPQLYRELRRQAVLYFTQALATNQWFEVKINIYDAEGHYEAHARRLELVLKDLEAGLILGETWTKDHALTLFSVAAYQIRLFTMQDPLDLKTLLLGLEYDAKGNRFVDIDLYHRQRKIEWGAIAKRLPFGRSRSGLHYRNELYGRLSPRTLEKLFGIEKSLHQ